MPQIIDPKAVHFLAFEGGGGKGVAFLGAVRALEDKRVGVLPIRPGGWVKGISGASAGAITALFLAMGCDSDELSKLLQKSEEFEKFFDPPMPLYYRSIVNNNPGLKTDYRDKYKPEENWAWLKKNNALLSTNLAAAISTSIKSIVGRPKYSSNLAYLNMASVFEIAKAGLSDSPPGNLSRSPAGPIIKALYKDSHLYLYNVLYDRGLFPGLGVRAFFDKFISQTLTMHFPSGAKRLGISMQKGGGLVNFAQFKLLTGVDLVITATNITRQVPLYFSARNTPNFPVAEAVAISMNLPVLFKPVYIDIKANVPPGLPDDAYTGFCVDGGVLNNLPIHAFDDQSAESTSKPKPDALPLNRHILGLRLMDGYNWGTRPKAVRTPEGDISFFQLLEDLFGTWSYPAEEGQIRTPDEREQTIELYTYDLSTIEFTPSASKAKPSQDDAQAKVLKNFLLR